MPILGVPLALIGLAALPALTAIYWLRTRFRRQEVSSLFLWSLVAQAHGGGRRATRLQTPLLWLIELLALMLLALAAAGPRIPRADRVVPVMVVMDDSFSMSAVHADGVSVRDKGVDAITQELSALGPFIARFVIAGPEPSLQEGSISRLADIERAVGDWRCESVSSEIGPAVALAREVGGPGCRVLVVTDHSPPEDQSPTEPVVQADRLRWRAVGEVGPNAAIVNAVRSTDPQRDQILLEVANFTDATRPVTLALYAGADKVAIFESDADDPIGPVREIDRRTLDLAAFETRRLRLAPPSNGAVLIARIDDDGLAADNRVVLMPPARAPLPVGVSIADPVLNKAVRSAVQASGIATIEPNRTKLTFTDRALPASAASTTTEGAGIEPDESSGTSAEAQIFASPWRVEFEVPPVADIDAYLGPFVIDYTHTLAAGLSLTGLVWAAPNADAGLPAVGRPVVSAGDTPLVSERDLTGSAKAIRIRLRADRSTLLNSAAWPVLIANIIDWRRAELPGLSHVNARPGLPVRLNLSSSIDHVSVTYHTVGGQEPTEPPNRVETRNGSAVLTSDRPGIYRVSAGEEIHRYTVNVMSAEESDLRNSATSEHGLWNDEQALRTDYRGLGWILGLLALGLLALHAWLLYRPRLQQPAAINPEGAA